MWAIDPKITSPATTGFAQGLRSECSYWTGGTGPFPSVGKSMAPFEIVGGPFCLLPLKMV
jgi:hypothetical protein